MGRLQERPACSFPTTMPSPYRSPDSWQPYSYLPNGPLSILLTDREVRQALGRLPFEPYAPVRRRLLCIYRAVNSRRLWARHPILSKWCLRLNRKAVRPFG
jgi:hypothetical protein